MAVDRFQLSGLARSTDPAHVALDRVEVGGYLAVAQPADADDDAAARPLLVAGRAIGDAAVHLHGASGRDAG